MAVIFQFLHYTNVHESKRRFIITLDPDSFCCHPYGCDIVVGSVLCDRTAGGQPDLQRVAKLVTCRN
jgi:hypothetical protein